MTLFLDRIRARAPLIPRVYASTNPVEDLLPVPDLPETSRIATLQRAEYSGAGICEDLRLPGCTIPLWPVQAQALEALRHVGGLYGPIGVGRGKTFVALLAGSVLGADLQLVLTKARIVDQTTRAFEALRGNYTLVPTRIVSYDILSRPDGTGMLEELVDFAGRLVVVCDEAHALKDTKSARTRRMLRFLRARPATHVVILSGTLLSRSIEDAAHLAEMALRERSPLPGGGVFRPKSRPHIEAWKEALDADGRPGPEHWERLRPLEVFGADFSLRGEARRASVRGAVARRLRCTPGVVCSGEDDLGVSLSIVPLVQDVSPEVEGLIQRLAGGELPDGGFVLDDIERWRHERELALGFWYRWDWPGDVPDGEWLRTRSRWFRLVRAELDREARTGYDSPHLVERVVAREVEQGARSTPLQRAWVEWDTHRAKLKPPTVPMWIDKGPLDRLLGFARGLGPALVWYESQAVEDELVSRGLDVYGAGREPPGVETGRPAFLCAASLCHATGRNLQQWSQAVVLESPAGGKAWEQLLGRLHRPGQRSDEVVFHVAQHHEVLCRALEHAKKDARFVAETTGERQRLCYADTGAEVRL